MVGCAGSGTWEIEDVWGGGAVAVHLKSGDDLGHPRLLGSNMGNLGCDVGNLGSNVGILGLYLLLEFRNLLHQRCDTAEVELEEEAPMWQPVPTFTILLILKVWINENDLEARILTFVDRPSVTCTSYYLTYSRSTRWYKCVGGIKIEIGVMIKLLWNYEFESYFWRYYYFNYLILFYISKLLFYYFRIGSFYYIILIYI